MVAVTGFAMYGDRDRALEAGFNDHLNKPLDTASRTTTDLGIRVH